MNDPGARSVTFDEVYAGYREQMLALHEGGVDLWLVETIFDTLNAKAAIKAILDLEDYGLEPCRSGSPAPSPTVQGAPCRARTVEAFWNSVRHAKPFAVGFNCALGAELMRPHVAEIARLADTLVAAPIRMRACPTPSANTKRSRTRPATCCTSGRRRGSSIFSAAVAAPRLTTSGTWPKRWRD